MQLKYLVDGETEPRYADVDEDTTMNDFVARLQQDNVGTGQETIKLFKLKYQQATNRWKWAFLGVAGAGAIVFLAAAAIPVAVAAMGFGAGGIAAGSTAAWFMSLYGGEVAAGSICAIAQSIGAGGWAASMFAGAAAAGAGTTAAGGIGAAAAAMHPGAPTMPTLKPVTDLNATVQSLFKDKAPEGAIRILVKLETADLLPEFKMKAIAM